VNGGAGVAIDYNQTQVIPKNGFVYVYPMNESHLNVWFDNVAVEHRTGPLLQESAFYPFGAPIVPLSSHAALKTVNERGFQQNEKDEEFGVDLSYFHARMYDASLGRFMGVDPEADKFSRFSPFHYAGNNPLHFVDPDGRFFFALLAKFAVKFIKKKVITKIAFKAGKKAAGAITNPFAKTFVGAFKMAKTGKALTAATKIGSWAGGLNNLRMNWDRMEGQNFGTALFRGAGYFLSGSAGGELAAMGTPLATLGGTVLGGMLNVETDLYSGSMGDVGFWRSFSRGGLSAMMGKGLAKSFLKGAGVKVGPDWTKEWWGQGVVSAVEKGAQTTMSNYNQYGKYGFGGDFMWKSLAAGAAAGALKGLGDAGFEWLDKKIDNPLSDLSPFSISLLNTGSDVTKKLMLKSMSKEYKEYLKKNQQISFDGFFNFFVPLSLYHVGKGK
jgi:RHS repeat-associated protein